MMHHLVITLITISIILPRILVASESVEDSEHHNIFSKSIPLYASALATTPLFSNNIFDVDTNKDEDADTTNVGAGASDGNAGTAVERGKKSRGRFFGREDKFVSNVGSEKTTFFQNMQEALSDVFQPKEELVYDYDQDLLPPAPAPVPASTDQSCALYAALVAQIEGDASDICGCDAEGNMECTFRNVCDDSTSVCARSVVYTVGYGNNNQGIKTKFCTEFVASTGFQFTCVVTETGIVDDEEVQYCHGATYANRPCRCTICDDQVSISIDCSEYDPYAYTVGCQSMQSFLPAFQYRSSPFLSVNIPENRSCLVFQGLSQFMEDASAHCGCFDADTVVCYHSNICNDAGLCAETHQMYLKLGPFMQTIQLETCLEFRSDFGFGLTCFDVEVGMDRSLQKCNGATLDGKECECALCGTNGVSIDCSMHDPFATTDGCQLMPTEIGPVLPAFQIRPQEPETEGVVQQETEVMAQQETEVVLQYLPRAVALNSFDTQSCRTYEIWSKLAPENKHECGCRSDRIVCTCTDSCHDDGNEVDTVEYFVELAPMLSSITITSCTSFHPALQFQQTCVEMAIDTRNTLQSCNRATYGGKPCRCQICNDHVSFVVDCSEHNPLATTNRCQLLPESFGPIVPAFQRSYQNAEDATCLIYQTLQNTIPFVDGICRCDGDSLRCTRMGFCDGLICADSFDVHIEEGAGNNRYTLESCTNFAHEDRYDKICITTQSTLVGKDLVIEECLRANIGATICNCHVCGDKRSLDIDCTLHGENVKTKGCQPYDAFFLPDFDAVLTAASAAPTNAVATIFFTTVLYHTLVLFMGAIL